jgi:hypothetical protein
MKPLYKANTTEQALAYLVEECGTVLAAIGKIQCCGLHDTPPNTPPNEIDTNRYWLLRELSNLSKAIELITSFLISKDGNATNHS